MIFNFLHYLQTRFPSYTFVAEGVLSGDPQERIEVRLVPGAVRGYPDNRSDDNVQLTVMHQDQYLCRAIAEDIFDSLRELYSVEMPPHPDEGTSGQTYTVSRLAALSRPIPGGRDKDGMFSYSMNYVLTYSG